METKLLKTNNSHFNTFPSSHYNCVNDNKFMSCTPLKPLIIRSPPTHKVLKVTQVPNITSYQDGWLDLIAINHVSQNLQDVAGITIEKEGYDGFVEACKVVTTKYNPSEQRELSLEAVKRSIPIPIFSLFKAVVPNSKLTRERLAWFASFFFAWLVGPSELKDSEFNGRSEKNVVHIQKCRFLESSNCVGMCTNLCKFPTQEFIKESMGMPVNMTPNFEDMSCDMIFGVEPPAPHEDPATKQPCYELCQITKRHTTQKQ